MLQSNDVSTLAAIDKDGNSFQVGNRYPKPRVSVLPHISWGAFLEYGHFHFPNVLDVGNAIDVSSGRAAIALALKHAGIKKGEKVLMPAFHCRSMIEPVLTVSAVPVYYRVHHDLAINLEDISEKIDDLTRALVITHYFGFLQDIVKIRNFCDSSGIILIEDCAHAFYGKCAGHPIGSYGDYAIASAKKFFPVHDGGFLVSSRHPIDDETVTNVSWMFNIKTAVNILENAAEYGRMKLIFYLFFLPLFLKNYIWKKIKSSASYNPINMDNSSASDGYSYLNLSWINKHMSKTSRIIMRLASESRIVRKRRSNYEKYAAAFAGLPKGRPLFPVLHEGMVPYMFALLVDEPDIVFPKLKRQGVPIWRWEEAETKTCDISASYSRCLLQIPCHQELNNRELEWIITCVKDAVSHQ